MVAGRRRGKPSWFPPDRATSPIELSKTFGNAYLDPIHESQVTTHNGSQKKNFEELTVFHQRLISVNIASQIDRAISPSLSHHLSGKKKEGQKFK